MIRLFSTIFSLVLLVLLTGCQGPSTSLTGQPPIHWGLGLTIPNPLPSPGVFREGAQNTTLFSRALNATITQVLKDCKAAPQTLPQERARIESGLLLEAIWQTINDCADYWNEARALVESTQKNRTETQTFGQLERDAVEAVTMQAAWLSSLPPPGSVADAEVLSELMFRNAYLSGVIATARDSFVAYNQSHNRLDLESAYLNTLDPIRSNDPTVFFVGRYPWSNGTCVRPDVPALEQWLGNEISWILDNALILEPPHAGIPVNDVYGATLKVSKPGFLYNSERAWWPALLGQVATVTLYRGILETHQENRLPTKDEANYLFALHQSTNRTWDRENQMQFFYGQINDGVSWDNHEPEARQALALSKMHSGFQDLHCVP